MEQGKIVDISSDNCNELIGSKVKILRFPKKMAKKSQETEAQDKKAKEATDKDQVEQGQEGSPNESLQKEGDITQNGQPEQAPKEEKADEKNVATSQEDNKAPQETADHKNQPSDKGSGERDPSALSDGSKDPREPSEADTDNKQNLSGTETDAKKDSPDESNDKKGADKKITAEQKRVSIVEDVDKSSEKTPDTKGDGEVQESEASVAEEAKAEKEANEEKPIMEKEKPDSKPAVDEQPSHNEPPEGPQQPLDAEKSKSEDSSAKEQPTETEGTEIPAEKAETSDKLEKKKPAEQKGRKVRKVKKEARKELPRIEAGESSEPVEDQKLAENEPSHEELPTTVPQVGEEDTGTTKIDINDVVENLSSAIDSLDEETKKGQEIGVSRDEEASEDNHLGDREVGDDDGEAGVDEGHRKDRRMLTSDPSVQESIRALIDSYTVKKMPEQLVASTIVMYTDVMNENRVRNTMKTMFRAAKLSNTTY